jgi:hypothetical protein
MDAQTEQLLKALEYFKDWSNFLLVTTVAALGWVATKDRPHISVAALRWTVLCFGASVVFAIFTLALIPIVAEGITKATISFYDTPARFMLLWLWGPELEFKLKYVCRLQHVLFLAGIIVFTAASIQHADDRGNNVRQAYERMERVLSRLKRQPDGQVLVDGNPIERQLADYYYSHYLAIAEFLSKHPGDIREAYEEILAHGGAGRMFTNDTQAFEAVVLGFFKEYSSAANAG